MPSTVGIPIGTRLLRVDRLHQAWRLWTDTRDYVYGTYILLHDDGAVYRITERRGEGMDVALVRERDHA